jgi:two-component system, NarL family, sensor histidine kinase UhpB
MRHGSEFTAAPRGVGDIIGLEIAAVRTGTGPPVYRPNRLYRGDDGGRRASATAKEGRDGTSTSMSGDPMSERRTRATDMAGRLVAPMPLFWRVFAIVATVLALATALLIFAPVTVSVPVRATELVVLLSGFAAMLVIAFVPLRRAFRALSTVTSTMRELDPLDPGRRVPVVGGPQIAGLAQAFNDMLARLEHERRESARQALTVQEAERQRVARELHDEVGQIFTAMMLQIESAAAHAPAQLHDELEELRETARTGATDVQRIAARLRPEALEDLGLQSALSALVSAFAEQTKIQTDKTLEMPGQLDREQELVVYRVAQEALTNVARHARASRVEVSLRRDGDDLVLRVRDDGQGLPPTAMRSSNGIRGMRERAMLIGARLTLSTPGRGTDVVLQVPTRTHSGFQGLPGKVS